MSDYAGPILGAVGAVVGGYFGGAKGAQWGWAIGSAIGGMYAQSQQVIPGPTIGEVARQTSQEGGFRPIIYGRSYPIAGNVIADGGPRIVTRRERQGKGGPKVESESAYRTYAVGVCEGEASLLQAWRNGILVYDAEDGSMAAENAKFREYATWYTGSFSQSASPDLEEIYGAGQAPFFRGTAYLSIHNEDVTDQRGAWSQWQFRVFRGAAKSYTTPPYPILLTQSLSASHSILDGRSNVSPRVVEQLSAMTEILSAELGQPVKYYSFEDSVSASTSVIDGELRRSISYYSFGDSVEATTGIIGGELKRVLIRYGPFNEQLSSTTEILGGALE